MIGLIQVTDSSAIAQPKIDGLQLGITQTLQMEERGLVDLAFDVRGDWPGVSGGFIKFFVTSPAASPLRAEWSLDRQASRWRSSGAVCCGTFRYVRGKSDGTRSSGNHRIE